MSNLKELDKKIHELKEYLNKLIDEKGNLLDPDIITVSKMVDTLLNEYDKTSTSGPV